MKTLKVYDLPVRLFHWSFVVLFVGAFFIAQVFDDDSAVYPLHMMMGLVLGAAVALRVIWGIVGTRYARFSSYDLNPLSLVDYFKQIFSAGPNATSNASKKTWTGHNPASSWSAIGMMAMGLAMVFTGVMMSQGVAKELFEEMHEVVAYLFLVTSLLHVGGVALHAMKHRDQLAFSMVTGTKNLETGDAPIESNHPVVALIFVIVVASFATLLYRGYDAQTRVLQFFGVTLNLGENEKDEKGSEKGEHGDKGDREGGEDHDD